MPIPLIDLNVPTPPDTDDEIDNDIDFTISDSQLVEELLSTLQQQIQELMIQ